VPLGPAWDIHTYVAYVPTALTVEEEEEEEEEES
jgi:hypothetical protein